MTALSSATRRAGATHAAAIAVILAAGSALLLGSSLPAGTAVAAWQLGLLALWAAATAALLVWVHAAEAFVVGFAVPLRRPFESGLVTAAAMALLVEGVVLGGGLLGALALRWLPLLPGARWLPDHALAARLLAALLATLLVGTAARGWIGAAATSLLAAGAALLGLLWALLSDGTVLGVEARSGLVEAWRAGTPVLALLPLMALAPAFRPPKRRTLGVGAAVLALAALALWLGVSTLQRTALGVRDLAGLALLVGQTPACLLAVLHRLVAGYEVAAGIERSGLLPAWLVQRSPRLGTPLAILGLQLAGLLAAALLLDVDQAFAVALALGGLATALFALHAAGLGVRTRRWWVQPLALLAVVGAALFVVAALDQAPALAGAALALAVGLAGLALILRAAQSRVPHLRAASVEKLAAASPHGIPILTLHEALDVIDNYRPRVLVATLRGSRELLERAALRAEDDRAVFVLYVDELPGMFYPPHVAPSATAVELLLNVCTALDARGYQGIPIWRVAHDVAVSIAQAAQELRVERVIVDVGVARPLGEVLRGRTLSRLRRLLGKVSLEVVRPGNASSPPSRA